MTGYQNIHYYQYSSGQYPITLKCKYDTYMGGIKITDAYNLQTTVEEKGDQQQDVPHNVFEKVINSLNP